MDAVFVPFFLFFLFCLFFLNYTISILGYKILHAAVTNQPPMKVFVTGNDYLTIIGYRHSLRSLLRLSL